MAGVLGFRYSIFSRQPHARRSRLPRATEWPESHGVGRAASEFPPDPVPGAHGAGRGGPDLHSRRFSTIATAHSRRAHAGGRLTLALARCIRVHRLTSVAFLRI